MEELPDVVLCAILANSGKGELNSLSRSSVSLRKRVTELTESNYLWKLMTENYIRVCIPDNIDSERDYELDCVWKDMYRFVTSIGNKKELFFSRDVLHAKIGLLLDDKSSGDVRTLSDELVKASIDTVKFLLTLPQLQEVWKDASFILTAISVRRQDICMLLIEDGRCLAHSQDIREMILDAMRYGCGEVFLRLVNDCPNKIPPYGMDDFYTVVCSYNLKDVAKKILEITNIIRDQLVDYGNIIFKYLEDGIVTQDIIEISFLHDISAMIHTGNALLAYKLVENMDDFDKYNNRGYYRESISIAIHNNEITDISQILPYITSGYVDESELLRDIVRNHNTSVSLVKQLSSLLHLIRREEIARIANDYGNWEFAEAILH